MYPTIKSISIYSASTRAVYQNHNAISDNIVPSRADIDAYSPRLLISAPLMPGPVLMLFVELYPPVIQATRYVLSQSLSTNNGPRGRHGLQRDRIEWHIILDDLHSRISDNIPGGYWTKAVWQRVWAAVDGRLLSGSGVPCLGMLKDNDFPIDNKH